MIILKTKYVLFTQWILTGLTFTNSVKTYQVDRINETSYIVTSFPDYEQYKRMFHMKSNIDNLFTNNDKRSIGIDYYNTPTVTVGDKKYMKSKIPSAYIKKVREHYFRNYYATMNKPKTPQDLYSTKPLVFDVLETDKDSKPMKLQKNLKTARKLASKLVFEVNNAIKENVFYSNVNRMKRCNQKNVLH